MTVHLVGAGPGDPELLTLRAARLLGDAELVVHDGLVPPPVLALAHPDAELVDVTKRGGRPSARQDDITELLVREGRAGRRVVRLKGGDPFVFGRGGEEALALAAAGVPVEVVPGISSAVAVPAAVGIPVTHRRVSAGVTVVTATRDPDAPPIDWAALAAGGTTLVVLMGARRARTIAEALLAGGLGPNTPAAAVVDGTTPDQTVWRGRLADLGLAPVASPATLVIGAVAGLDVTAPNPIPAPTPQEVLA